MEEKKVKILALPEWQIDDPLRVVFTRLISGGHQFVISNSNEGPPSFLFGTAPTQKKQPDQIEVEFLLVLRNAPACACD